MTRRILHSRRLYHRLLGSVVVQLELRALPYLTSRTLRYVVVKLGMASLPKGRANVKGMEQLAVLQVAAVDL